MFSRVRSLLTKRFTFGLNLDRDPVLSFTVN